MTVNAITSSAQGWNGSGSHACSACCFVFTRSCAALAKEAKLGCAQRGHGRSPTAVFLNPCTDGMEVRRPRVVEALARIVYPLDEPQLAAMTPSHVRRAQLVCHPHPDSMAQN